MVRRHSSVGCGCCTRELFRRNRSATKNTSMDKYSKKKPSAFKQNEIGFEKIRERIVHRFNFKKKIRGRMQGMQVERSKHHTGKMQKFVKKTRHSLNCTFHKYHVDVKVNANFCIKRW
jgi:hypothetical protein